MALGVVDFLFPVALCRVSILTEQPQDIACLPVLKHTLQPQMPHDGTHAEWARRPSVRAASHLR